MKNKKIKTAHTPKSAKGMGDYYGSGIRNPIGKIRDVSGEKSPSKLKKPPRSLA